MDLVKACTRCKKGIYTSWRTLDNKKYYHPHCFTCVDCGVILESVPKFEVASATSQEIYCGQCYNDRICANKMDQKKYDRSQLRVPFAPDSSSRGSGNCSKKLLDDNNNVNVLFSSPAPFILHRNDESCPHECDESSNGTIGSMKKKLKKSKTDKNNEFAEVKGNVVKKKKSRPSPSTVMMDQLPKNISTKNVTIERKSSRIPRPASVQSRKSLITATTSAKLKPESGQTERRAKNSSPRPSAFHAPSLSTMPFKMQRSISMVQARNTGGPIRGTEKDGSSITASGSNKSFGRSTSSPRPYSALTSARKENRTVGNDQQMGEIQCVKMSSSKRQCAASFSETKRKRDNRKQQPRKQSNECLASYSNVAQLNGGLPSTQTILTAIRRQCSRNISMKKSSSEIKLERTESYSVPSPVNPGVGDSYINIPCASFANPPQLPKRSFNMTFECPICISSLVPGCGNSEKYYTDPDRNSCHNVVTPCGHLFHGKCMDNWLQIKGNKRCPICSAICLPETLQPVYLECNLCADLIPKTLDISPEPNGLRIGMDEVSNASYRTLRSEFELLKAKYSAVVAENHNYSLNASLAHSLQSAYEMECRNRLQLQWENRKLLMRIEQMKNSRSSIFDL